MWRADRTEGYFLHGWTSDDLRLEDARELRPAVRRDGHREIQRSRRRHARPDEHGRIREGLLDRDLVLRQDAQPLGPEGRAGWIEWRIGGRRGRRSRAGCDRYGYGRLNSPACGAMRHYRHQAVLRARLALRHDR